MLPGPATLRLLRLCPSCPTPPSRSVLQQPALELCARSVAGSSGDLRQALRACRAALDNALRRYQQQQPPAQAGPVTVTMRDMAAALTQLAGVRSTQASAAHAASIRALPNQQQLVLFALSTLCPLPAEEGAGSGTPAASPAARLLAGPSWASTPTAKAQVRGGEL